MINEIELRTSLNNRYYITKVYLCLGATEIFTSSGSLGQDNLVVKIDSILEVNPKSLKDKLKTILTFL